MSGPYWAGDDVTLHLGDCIEVMAGLPDASVDAVVCDPPYGLEFMGREWDGADGFRRSLNPADAGRDDVFGRASRSGPEYRTKPAGARLRTREDGRTNPREGKSRVTVPESYSTGQGQRGKPGLGDRPTDWVSNQGWNGFRCRTCGHLSHGGSPCRCENPDFARADSRWNLYQEWCEAWAAECLRVLKPGGHLVSFGGTRTYHRLTCGIEDAGFEIRDSLHWLYAQGFPKSLNPGDGLGTGLRPSHEPIILARKPLAGTVVANVAKHGTGALSIDDCRIAASDQKGSWAGYSKATGDAYAQDKYSKTWIVTEDRNPGSRWPPNVLLDPEAAAELDRQSGTTTSRIGRPRQSAEPGDGYGMTHTGAEYADSGGASRFFPVFRYEAKADARERPRLKDGTAHPTVKPVDLMAWLVRLVSRPGALILDPFAGSGTTGQACVAEGRRCVLIEQHEPYAELIKVRLSKPIQPGLFDLEAS